MAGRPQIFDEAEVLEKATNLFWTKGYEATSTDDLLDVMGIGKSSFYHAFKGKRELFELVIERFVNQSIAGLMKDIETSHHPIDAIKRFFRAIATTPNTIHQKGCFMGNTIVELSNIDKSLENKAIKKLKKMEQVFAHQISKAQQSGELKNKEEAATIARYLVTQWNGLNITRRMYPDANQLLPMIELQLNVLK